MMIKWCRSCRIWTSDMAAEVVKCAACGDQLLSAEWGENSVIGATLSGGVCELRERKTKAPTGLSRAEMALRTVEAFAASAYSYAVRPETVALYDAAVRVLTEYLKPVDAAAGSEGEE